MVLKKAYILGIDGLAQGMAQVLTIDVRRVRHSTKHYIISPLDVLAKLLQLVQQLKARVHDLKIVCIDEYGRKHEVEISSVRVSGNKVYVEFGDSKVRCARIELQLY